MTAPSNLENSSAAHYDMNNESIAPSKLEISEYNISLTSCETNKNTHFLERNDLVVSFDKYLVEKENMELKHLDKHLFSFKLISKNNKLIQYYTSIKDWEFFDLILNICSKNPINYYAGWNMEGLCKVDQLLMALMKLKLNSGHMDLSIRFGVRTLLWCNL